MQDHLRSGDKPTNLIQHKLSWKVLVFREHKNYLGVKIIQFLGYTIWKKIWAKAVSTEARKIYP